VRFGYTILYVEDVARSLGFYGRALGLERRFLHESGEYGELETGATALAFATHELAASNLPGVYDGARQARCRPPFEVCFVTADVAGAYERALAAGAEAVTEPQTKPWGQDVAYVSDPDGNLIELASPVE
jgi:catechol 2,3-dioxygenase-like lactoylglutathione lyase family enzyme